jgi:hypothetical protein
MARTAELNGESSVSIKCAVLSWTYVGIASEPYIHNGKRANKRGINYLKPKRTMAIFIGLSILASDKNLFQMSE